MKLDVETNENRCKTGCTHRRMQLTSPSLVAEQLLLARFHDCSGCPVCSSRSPWIKRFILAHDVKKQRNISKRLQANKDQANLLDCWMLQNLYLKKKSTQSGISAATTPASAESSPFLAVQQYTSTRFQSPPPERTVNAACLRHELRLAKDNHRWHRKTAKFHPRPLQKCWFFRLGCRACLAS